MDPATELASKFSDVVINPLIALVFAAGLLVFVWGMVEYLWSLSNSAKDRDQGKRHMLWGIIGMFVMTASYTILKIIANSLGAPIPHL